ncbi:MAG: hypothetical protein ACHP7N_04515 [Caulobacterales bacterium]
MAELAIEDALRRASLIGSICVHWSAIEGYVALTIWEMLGVRAETGKILTGGLDMLPRLNMAILLARHLKAGKKIERALVALRKEIQDGLDQRRNVAVHGLNYVIEGKVLVEMHRGRGDRTRREFPINELAQTEKDLGRVMTAYSAALLPWSSWWVPKRDAIALKILTAASEARSKSGS